MTSSTRDLSLTGATKARELLSTAIDHGRSASWVPGVDSGGSTYVTVTVLLPDRSAVRATWHTRTGSWRFFGALAGPKGRERDVTLKAARALISGP
jgi:hypothetical protein